MSRSVAALAGLLAMIASAVSGASGPPVDTREPARIEHLLATGDGGFWAFLGDGQAGKTLHLVRFDTGGEPVEERQMHVSEGWLSPFYAEVDAQGRVWTIWSPPIAREDRPPYRWRLQVFGTDGSPEAGTETKGSLLGLTGDGAARVLREGGDDEEPRVLRVDPFVGSETLELHLPRDAWGTVDPDSSAEYVHVSRPAGHGAVYTFDLTSPVVVVVRRYEPPGVAAGEWRVPITWHYHFAPSTDGGTLFLDDGEGVVRLGPGVAPESWRLDAAVREIAADGDAAWVLTADQRVVRLRADGSAGSPLDLDPPPVGTTYAERRRLRDEETHRGAASSRRRSGRSTPDD